ncbi:hypothetical protein JADG_006018 [Aureobasidium aubasidani]|nr:hypothetical protein JADG_006018 [Aureobasidium pullulans]
MTTPMTPQPQANPQSSPPRILTAVQTKIAYNVGTLSPTSQKHAQEGLCDGRMSMTRCYKHDDEYYFELQEKIRVKVSDEETPTCSSCSNSDGSACRHIWWVNDQILNTKVAPHDKSRAQYEMSRDGQAARENGRANQEKEGEPFMFYDYLDETELPRVAKLGGWWMQDPSDRRDLMLVEQTAADILSACEPCGILSKQHGQDNFEMLQRESQALFARYRNEMIRQVKSAPFLLIALGAAVPEAERDLLHLTKIHSRIERILFDFGYWRVIRTPNESNLDATAEALHNEIGYLQSFVLDPRHYGKMGISLQGRIVGILLYTLEQLIVHAADVHDSAAVTTPQYSGLSLKDRSLLHKMIDPTSQSMFALDVLGKLGQEVLHNEMVQERAERLADLLRNEPVPEVYIQELEKLVGLVG